jgi:hypothetical protein
VSVERYSSPASIFSFSLGTIFLKAARFQVTMLPG